MLALKPSSEVFLSIQARLLRPRLLRFFLRSQPSCSAPACSWRPQAPTPDQAGAVSPGDELKGPGQLSASLLLPTVLRAACRMAGLWTR